MSVCLSVRLVGTLYTRMYKKNHYSLRVFGIFPQPALRPVAEAKAEAVRPALLVGLHFSPVVEQSRCARSPLSRTEF
jgi:hypothetical protein